MKTIEMLVAGRAKRDGVRGDEGFTLIELLIVMSVMLILMTLGIPQLLKLRKTANETSAMQSVRTIGQAELSYSSTYPSNGFACSLAALGGAQGSGAPTPQSAQILPSDLAAGQKAGYTYAITNCTKVTVNNQDMFTSFQVTAVPNSVGRTGDRGFCSDENNVIKFDPQGGTNCTQTLQ
ncbi:prepilin-type N-terminal cleavage/methylation domain-containing protein [Granulicella sibirica]|uniref:Type IV pilin PilA n=1 Tax=Granulicella sibirica TaxID=2479048 RepID=A0A4Q0T5A1_9BACT|nr:prepilin-type N-terminal cleavage/methylation domain-containing protein [Granulicella sibirica]RXH56741.1 Type IV pilin PilA [Granulicella sibirica]